MTNNKQNDPPHRKGLSDNHASIASHPTGMTDQLPSLSEVIRTHELQAKKSFGQNFLLDLNLTRKIARYIPDLSTTPILEIGPGPGGLTRALLMEGAENLLCIEKDERCEGILNEISNSYRGKLKYNIGDAMTLNLPEIRASLGEQPIHIAANLPYNVGTALLVNWLTTATWPPFYAGMTLMFQKEVAERIIATPKDKAYGRLAILVGWRPEAKILFDLPPSAFTPAPKVTSSVVQITPKSPMIDGLDVKKLGRLTEMTFGQRRKMLRASLKPLKLEDGFLETLGINPQARPETLEIRDFCQLALALSDKL